MVIRSHAPYRWDDVEVHPYKEDGSHFRSITRQTLLQVGDELGMEMRYFEIQADGHSTLERHEHQHAVMILRGKGQVLVGDTISAIGEHDIVHIAPLTWHQFRANQGEPLGFLCVVSCERDRPQRPNEDDLKQLASSHEVAEFIKV